MSQSAAPHGASGAHRVVRSAISAAAKLWAQLKRFHRPITAIAAFPAVLSGFLGYWSAHEAVEKVLVPKSAGTLASRAGPPPLSLAVMPFTTDSKSAEDERLAETLTQEVSAGIERARHSVVLVSHGLVVAKYKGKPTDPQEVGRNLNVLYLIEGNVSRQNEADVVVARLIETITGTTVWSARLVAATSSADTDKSEFAFQLSNRLRGALYDAEETRAARLPRSDASAMETVLRAHRVWQHDSTAKGSAAAHKLYEEALRQDPNSVEAMIGLYWTVGDHIDLDAEPDEQTVRELNELSKRAISLDRDNPRVWEMRWHALFLQKQWQGAFEANADRPISQRRRREPRLPAASDWSTRRGVAASRSRHRTRSS